MQITYTDPIRLMKKLLYTVWIADVDDIIHYFESMGKRKIIKEYFDRQYEWSRVSLYDKSDKDITFDTFDGKRVVYPSAMIPHEGTRKLMEKRIKAFKLISFYFGASVPILDITVTKNEYFRLSFVCNHNGKSMRFAVAVTDTKQELHDAACNVPNNCNTGCIIAAPDNELCELALTKYHFDYCCIINDSEISLHTANEINGT